MYNPITENHKKRISQLLKSDSFSAGPDTAESFAGLIEIIRNDIPEKKRISFGRYSISLQLGIYLFPFLEQKNIDIMNFAKTLFTDPDYNQFVRSLGVQLLSLLAEKDRTQLDQVLHQFEDAAMSDDWIVRECAAGYIRKLIPLYTDIMHKWYLRMIKSDNPLQRRFACESLRPVAENKWFRKNPYFALSVISNLFRESEPYPRSSAGNSLSDWMRINQDQTLKTVKQLAESGDKNSYWIAARACRNLVKKEPLLVMDILKTDSYIYKDRKYFRRDYHK